MPNEFTWRIESLEDLPPWDWPKGAHDAILQALRDRKRPVKERTLAAHLGGEIVVMDDVLAEALLEIFMSREEPEEIRAAAAISFGPALQLAWEDGFEDPGSVPISEAMYDRIRAALRQVHDDTGAPKEVRRRALEAAVRAEDEWLFDAARAAYKTGDREWVLTALFAMGHMDGFDREILDALRSKEEEIQREAIIAAGSREIDGAWGVVSGLVARRGSPKPILLAAIPAAASIRPEEVYELLDPLRDSKDSEIREAVEDALALASEDHGWDEDDDDEEDEGE